MKRPLAPEFIDMLDNLAHIAGCDWYQDNDGNFIITKDKDAYENMIRYPTMTREQIYDIVNMTVRSTMKALEATKATTTDKDKDKPIDEDKFKDLLLQCDDDQKAIIQRFTRLMINSGIHGTRFGMTVIGAGHEGDHALVTLKVDLFNTGQYADFSQKQINMMHEYRLKMIKLEAPDSSPWFYITLLDTTNKVRMEGSDKLTSIMSEEQAERDKAKGIIR